MVEDGDQEGAEVADEEEDEPRHQRSNSDPQLDSLDLKDLLELQADLTTNARFENMADQVEQKIPHRNVLAEMFEQHLIRNINLYSQKSFKKKTLKGQHELIASDLLSL